MDWRLTVSKAFESTDPVDRDNGRLRVQLQSGRKEVNNALSTCPGRQGELEGAASNLEGFGLLLGKNTGDQDG